MRKYNFNLAEHDRSFDHGSARGVDLDTTLARVEKHKDLLCITRVADITGYDRLGIPIITATRVNLNQHQISATQGKGNSKEAATVSAYMESVERHFCKTDTEGTYHTIDELKDSSTEFWLPEYLSPEKSKSICWRKSLDICSGRNILLPLAEICFPYSDPKDQLSTMSVISTTGVAAGNSEIEAIFQAACEVIERYLVSEFYLGRLGAKAVIEENISCEDTRRIYNTFIEQDIDLIVLDLSDSSPIPVYIVVSWDDSGLLPPVFVGGQGCHIDPTIALRRALFECAQSRAVVLQGSREDLDRHKSQWHSEIKEAEGKWAETKQTVKSFPLCNRLLGNKEFVSSPMESLDTLLDKLAESGFHQLLTVNRNCFLDGISVCSVVIPGMKDDWTRFMKEFKNA